MFLKKILTTFAVSCLNVNVKLDKRTANTRVKKHDGLGMNKFDVLLLGQGYFAERRTPNAEWLWLYTYHRYPHKLIIWFLNEARLN